MKNKDNTSCSMNSSMGQSKIELITRIQAVYRGYCVRSKLKHSVKETQIDDNIDSDDELEERDEEILPNNAVYKGQWKGETKHGYGIQIWPDGAKYEGYWKNNKANGKGKFYHVEGDIYDG